MVVVEVAPPAPTAAPVVVLVPVPVPLIAADSRVVDVVVLVVVSGVVQDVSTKAKMAAAGARIVSFFIWSLDFATPDYREPLTVVVVLVVAAGRVTAVDSRTVVVLVAAGVGVSTTVVQEVKTVAAIASAGARMISFFIIEELFHPQFVTEPLVSRIGGQVLPS